MEYRKISTGNLNRDLQLPPFSSTKSSQFSRSLLSLFHCFAPPPPAAGAGGCSSSSIKKLVRGNLSLKAFLILKIGVVSVGCLQFKVVKSSLSQFVEGASVLLIVAITGYTIGFVTQGRNMYETQNDWTLLKCAYSIIALSPGKAGGRGFGEEEIQQQQAHILN
ncbi:hypothetical protein K1719_020800 [Acacia pycnantha]|nr:hypothetical protein K1719_020800 [Acacia pycnantha]